MTDENNDEMSLPEDGNDYYEVLGVDEDASISAINQHARKLLAENHPDSESGSRDEYKRINTAQSVLTDKEQRLIYDKIGHNEYVRRREEDGTLSLSKNKVKKLLENQTTGSSNGASTSGNNEEGGRTISDGISNVIGYGSVDKIDVSLSPAEWTQRTYSQIWAGRLIIFVAIGAAVFNWASNSPAELLNLWAWAPFVGSSAGVATALTIAVTLAISVIPTSLIARWRIPTESFDFDVGGGGNYPDGDGGAEPKATASPNRRVESKQPQSGSMNVSSNVQGNDEVMGSVGVSEEVEQVNQSATAANDEPERVNKALSYGRISLMIAGLLSFLGAYTGTDNPWMTLATVSNTGDISWIGVEAGPTIEIISGAYIAVLVFTSFFGVILTTHGLSKDIWHQTFAKGREFIPELWDAAFIFVGSLFASGMAFSSARLSIEGVESGFVTRTLALVGSQTLISFSIASVFVMLGLHYLFSLVDVSMKWRNPQ